MRLLRSWFTALTTGLAAAAVVAMPASPAQATPLEENFTITLSGAFGDAVYTRQAGYWISVNQENQLEQQLISIQVFQGDMPEMSFDFSSRDGSKRYLEVDYYDHAQRYPFTDPGRPGISIGPLGFCNDESGNFEVRHIEHTDLAITKLWITYQRWCSGSSPAFGEIRLGYPDPAVEVSPSNIRWPGTTTYPGRSSYDVPVLVRATGSTTASVNSVSIVGAHAADFPLLGNGCSGQLTTSGCVLSIGFTPKAPGPRHAQARISTTVGDSYVSLDGFGALGESAWTLDVDYENPSQTDEHLEMPSASIGNPYEFKTQAYGSDGLLWNASFDLAGNATFVPGHYEYRADGSWLLMSLSRGNAACEIDRAVVDIADIAFSGPDNELDRFDLTMDVHCKASYGHTVRGHLRFHDRVDVTAPAAVQNLQAYRLVDDVTVSWTNPADADLAGVIVRWYAGTNPPGGTDGGEAVYVGTGQSVTFRAASGAPAAISIWAYDTAGNVSLVASLVVSAISNEVPRRTSGGTGWPVVRR